MPIWPFGRKKGAGKDLFDDRGVRDYMAFQESKEGRLLQRHFELTQQIQDAPKSRVESLCVESIKMAPGVMAAFRKQHEQETAYHRQSGREPHPFRPARHIGFQQLAIIHEREKRYEDAIRLCEDAKRQGWSGDWDKRIERCRAKMAKVSG